MRSLTVALAAAAITLTVSSVASANTPDVDMEKVHEAYWNMSGATHTDALQWFETEVNKYYYGDGFVSIYAGREDVEPGQPRVVVRGYVDTNGDHQWTPGVDQQVFAFVQNGTINGYSVNYEYLDAWGNVYYRGARAIPQTPFYMSYYYNWRTPVVAYYTPAVRIGYLRTWRTGWRTGGVYLGWRRGFVGYRTGYATRIAGFRTRYGVPRARIYTRPAIRVAPRVVAPRVNVRVNVGRRR
jgi:hypothetical protein